MYCIYCIYFIEYIADLANEQIIWTIFYLLGTNSVKSVLNNSAAGALLLMLPFQKLPILAKACQAIKIPNTQIT